MSVELKELASDFELEEDIENETTDDNDEHDSLEGDTDTDSGSSFDSEEDEEGLEEREIDPDIKRRLKEADRLKRLVYSQQRKIDEIQSERDRYYNIAGQSFDESIENEENKLKDKIEKLNAYLEYGLEEGDKKLFIEKNAELAKATAELTALEQWKSTEYQKNRRANNAAQSLDPYRQQAILDYVGSRFEVDSLDQLNNLSNDKKRIFDAVQEKGRVIDNELWRTGNSHLIGTEQYFDVFDQIIAHESQSGGKGGADYRAPTMKGRHLTTSPVSGRNMGSSYGGGDRNKLTQSEKDFADAMGLDENEFLKSKRRIAAYESKQFKR